MSETLNGPGATLGSYEILDEVGRGGLGIVYRARHVHLGRTVALKVLHPVWTSSREFVSRFREEGRVMALLEHPNILRVYDAGQADGGFFLAMAFLEGQNLEALLRAAVPTHVALGITRQIGRALAYAHSQGVIHRDVKPANVMVGPRGEVTLMDFGVARLRDSPGLTMPGIRVGTPYYMAPEQIVGRKADHRSDLYALGVVLHQLLSGRVPYPGPDTEEVFEGHLQREPPPLESAPEWLQRVVRKMLAKVPEERFESVDAFLAALDAEGEAGVIPRSGTGPAPAFAPAPMPVSGPSAVPPPPAAVAAATPAPGGEVTGAGGPGGRSSSLVREDRGVLALDIAGSSRMKHPGLTMTVQEQFTQFREYIRTHLQAFGCLDSLWSGDGLLALFTRPGEAAACAAAVLDGLGRFNAPFSVQSSVAQPIRVRLGVHHGPITRADGQPLGEVISRTLDTAAHLQKSAPEDTVLISEATYFALKDPSPWEPAGNEYMLVFPFRVYRYGSRSGGTVPRSGNTPSIDSATLIVLRLEIESGARKRDASVVSEVLIGRPDPGAGSAPKVEVPDDAVSRRHARIYRGADGFYVEDLDSANGTCVNGEWLEPGTPRLLWPGDRIELGEQTTLRVAAIEPAEE